ncbi:hypothetical protein PtA15_8A622 [Puccinia triticina]|uniref:Histone chaperone domain-containing protein n=1 Tax=Puccinia triticina TaxID=208348 RepID=A0ABY7CUC5_9BASI|nr:uncharacterized protein PtA15_8A622 [Puccinia triticina]WAQ87716.1 hypothetical protein PtA15_8A622 [Puccinia triticina]
MTAPNPQSTRKDPSGNKLTAEDSADSGQSIEIEAQSEAEPVSDSEPVAAAKKTTKPKKKKKKVLTIPEKKTNTSSASKKKVNSKKTETTDHDFDQDTDEGSVVVRSQGGKARKDNIANPPHAEEYNGGSKSDFGSANELCSVDDKASNCDSDNPEQENTTLADENSDTELNINTKSKKLRRLTVKVCTSSSASGLAWA